MLIELTLTNAQATPIYLNPNHIVAVYRSPNAAATSVVCVSSGGGKRNVYAVLELPEEIAEDCETRSIR
ncbi:hypothetical protein RB623_23240 [Mesorhizobium sp. LHD-90]|uniref:hypothetical protein n=1 Tax=Mesorhizobium sp. LHD-90 TaxID=3071414 RepID=UPI0027E104C0|nr:hypothetical protein [Mesorhizobium sp. LHD-90]MDQ6436976.1 hypothetical protein [Mesorhizobium sp. LHD-90]